MRTQQNTTGVFKLPQQKTHTYNQWNEHNLANILNHGKHKINGHVRNHDSHNNKRNLL